MNFVNEDITFDTLRALLISEAAESNAAKEAHKRGLVAGGKFGDWLDPITGELRGRTGPTGEFVELTGYGRAEDPDKKKKKQAADAEKKVKQTDMFGGSSDSDKDAPKDAPKDKKKSSFLPDSPGIQKPQVQPKPAPKPAAGQPLNNAPSWRVKKEQDPNFIKNLNDQLFDVFNNTPQAHNIEFVRAVLDVLGIPSDVKVNEFPRDVDTDPTDETMGDYNAGSRVIRIKSDLTNALRKIGKTISEIGWAPIMELSRQHPTVKFVKREPTTISHTTQQQESIQAAYNAIQAIQVLIHEGNHALDKTWNNTVEGMISLNWDVRQAAYDGSYRAHERVQVEPMTEFIARENFKLLSGVPEDEKHSFIAYQRYIDGTLRGAGLKKDSDQKKKVEVMEDLWNTKNSVERSAKFKKHFSNGFSSYLKSNIETHNVSMDSDSKQRYDELYGVFDKLTDILPLSTILFTDATNTTSGVFENVGNCFLTQNADGTTQVSNTADGIIKIADAFVSYLHTNTKIFTAVAMSTGPEGRKFFSDYPAFMTNPNYISTIRNLQEISRRTGIPTPDFMKPPKYVSNNGIHAKEHAQFLLQRIRG